MTPRLLAMFGWMLLFVLGWLALVTTLNLFAPALAELLRINVSLLIALFAQLAALAVIACALARVRYERRRLAVELRITERRMDHLHHRFLQDFGQPGASR